MLGIRGMYMYVRVGVYMYVRVGVYMYVVCYRVCTCTLYVIRYVLMCNKIERVVIWVDYFVVVLKLTS